MVSTRSSCILPIVVAITAFTIKVSCCIHHVLVGNFGTDYNVTAMLDGTQDVGAGYLYTLEVDAKAGSLTLKNTSAAAAAHPWLSINVRCIRTRVF